ncbi:hypothetical protein HAX54_039202 [Datura stramonium]|uniref:Uncharacterized protein n=1 Tax=Datura stramonium TaxID=4076 RepID=A0ABS8VKZ1_DATST|nr:hypothetical protein [Datura stramonium]
MDELIGNLKTYELKKQQNLERREPKRDVALKAAKSDSSEDEADMDYLTHRKSGHLSKSVLFKNRSSIEATPRKGNKAFNEVQVELEDELKKVKINLTAQLDRNEKLELDLVRVKADLDKSLQWTWSSQPLASINKGTIVLKKALSFKEQRSPMIPTTNMCQILIIGSALTAAKNVIIRILVRIKILPLKGT